MVYCVVSTQILATASDKYKETYTGNLMNTIKSTFNIDTKEWEIDTTTTEFVTTFYEVQFAFCSNEEVTVFSDLRFGYELLRNDKEFHGEAFVISNSYPKDSARLLQVTSTTPIQTDKITCIPAISYTLKFWATNAGEQSETEHVFTAPTPPAPFVSWTWNGTEWVPPIARPEGTPAFWNETTQAWVPVTDPVAIDDASRDDISRANAV